MYRIFILGAGFSRPSGLPLGNELFSEVWKLAEIREYSQGQLGNDLKRYSRFVAKTTGCQPKIENINLEDFISFLDVEHILHLKGSDQWSDEGNKSQLILRNLIALALKLKQDSAAPDQLRLYDDFVKNLTKMDFIATFNYDTLLEEAMERNGISYRLVPGRFEEVDEDGGTFSDEDDDETVILKLHGSIDWFDISHYERQRSSRHPVFGVEREYKYSPLIREPYPVKRPLYKLQRLHSMSEYLAADEFIWEAPIIISPSTHKLAYINRFSELWREISNVGYYANSVGIIGFSIAPHDIYLKQVIYDIVNKFQNVKGERRGIKTKLKMIDYRKTREQISDYKSIYSFVNWNDTESYFDGFNDRSLEGLFSV